MLTKLRIRCSGSETTLDSDAHAVAGHTLVLVSVAGPASTIKALAAVLQTKIAAEFWMGDCFYEKYAGGYTCHKCRLGYNTWHMIAVADHKGILLDGSDTALWRELQSERFTTPLLRDWVPEIRRVCEDAQHLRRCGGHGCTTAVVRLDDATLDSLVSAGLCDGRLKIA